MRGPRGQTRTTGAYSLAGRLAQSLRSSLHEPRYLAEKFIREHLDCSGPFLGDGTAECPWIVLDSGLGWYAFYLRGRELVNAVRGGQDHVVCVL